MDVRYIATLQPQAAPYKSTVYLMERPRRGIALYSTES
jgi:hypothetical protein